MVWYGCIQIQVCIRLQDIQSNIETNNHGNNYKLVFHLFP